MGILCTICARGGSKGVKDKNIRDLAGKPLIAHTIEAAKKWGRFDEIVVSTDSEKIQEVALKYGALIPFTRPAELATDTVGKMDSIKHAVRFMEQQDKSYEVVIDLQPTSPIRLPDDIEGAYTRLINEDRDIVYSVCESEANPYYTLVELDSSGIPRMSKKPDQMIVARQAAPKVYRVNGSIYVYKKEFLLNTNTIHGEKAGIYVMPEERSVDIDREFDFKLAEFIMSYYSYN